MLVVPDVPVKGGQRNWEVYEFVTAAAVVYNAAVSIVRQAEEADARSMRGKLVQDHIEQARHGVVGVTAREDLSIRCGRKWEGELFGYGP